MINFDLCVGSEIQKKRPTIFINEYERIKAIADMLEYYAIADIIEERMPDGKVGKTILLEDYHTNRMSRRAK